MASPTLRRLGLLCSLVFLGVATNLRAGGEGALDFVREFLSRYPSFQAEGVMTSSLPGRNLYRCRVELAFEKGRSALFAYNTDGARNIIPYDLNYRDRRLVETVYNRDRTEVLSTRDDGPPHRTLFNFVWDVLAEAEQGPGFKSLVFTGLMAIELNEVPRRSHITLSRRFPVIPVQSVQFTFDDELRLRSLQITLADGGSHRIDIRRFRPVRAE